MKLLFENWRKYLNENLSKKEIEQAISDASFNSAQSSQHRWGRGQPIIDYIDFEDGLEQAVAAVFSDELIASIDEEQTSFWRKLELENSSFKENIVK